MTPSPLVVLRDGFMSASTSRDGLPARHLANPRSSCSRSGVERLSPPVSISIHLGPFTRCTEDGEFTAQTYYVSQTRYVWMVWMLRASAKRAQKELMGRSRHHSDKGA